VAFRAVGVAFALACAARASRSDELAWAGALVFGYFLWFAGETHPWYWLPLVPLLPFAAPRLQPAMRAVCVLAVAAYPLHLHLACADEQGLPLWDQVLGNGLELALLNVPPLVLLVRARRAAATPAAVAAG
jgi:hypothetical protein